MNISALVPLVDGVEEIEAVTIIDVFRRAGWEVTSAGLSGSDITASRSVRIRADCLWSDITPEAFSLLALPGGARAAEAMRTDHRLIRTLRRFNAEGKIIGAICAAPVVLSEAGVITGRRVTSHPSVAAQLSCAAWVDQAVVLDGNIVTGQGAGTAIQFALAIVRAGGCDDAARLIALAMCLNSPQPDRPMRAPDTTPSGSSDGSAPH